MKIQLDSRFKKQVRGVFEKYEFSVGVDDKPHFAGKRGQRGFHGQDVLTEYARGPARIIDKDKQDGTNATVAESLRKRMGINFWTKPFQAKREINQFLNEFFKYAFGKSEAKRLTNTLQAVVRNPFLKGEYAHNSKITQAIKGFDRFGVDTAQFVKSISATVRKKQVL